MPRLSVDLDQETYDIFVGFAGGYPRMKGWMLKVMVKWCVRHWDEALHELLEAVHER